MFLQALYLWFVPIMLREYWVDIVKKFLNIFVEPESPDVGWDTSVFPWCIFQNLQGFEGKAE